MGNPMFEKLLQRWEHERKERERTAREMERSLLANGKLVFERFRVKQVFLFGSVLQRQCSPQSDIDILVIPLKSTDYWQFKRELELQVGYPIDLHTEESDAFTSKIKHRGKLIYEA